MQLVDNQYFASCPVGFEEVLAEELTSRQVQGIAVTRGGVHFNSKHEKAIELMIWSRIASRVFRKILIFNAHSENDLYQSLNKIEWNKILRLDQSFSFKSIFTHSKKRKCFVKNSHFLNLKAKDSVCDLFMKKKSQRPNVEVKNPDYSFLLHIKANQKVDKVSLLVDMCGEPLSHRGYRSSGFQAPLRENLAAGLIKLAKWNPSEEDFVDGMCGSGTFLIEAMLIAKKIPPTDLRSDENWSFRAHLNTENGSVEKPIKENSPLLNSIQGFDIDSRAIRQSRIHLDSFKEQDVKLFQKDFFDIEWNDKPKLVLLNPPYGERMGKQEDLEDLYFQIGERFKNHAPNTRFGIICSDKKLLQKIRLKPHQKHEVFNGGLRSYFYLYQIY